MITTLENLNPTEAAGVLARAAFSIEDVTNPASNVRLPGEEGLRRQVLAEARAQLGIARDDFSEEATQKLSDFLDIEIGRIASPENTETVLDALATKGQLPSDLYTIRIDHNISDFFGKKFDAEEELIRQTVACPNKDQQYGPSEDRNSPYLISLFAKTFPNKFPFRSFTMLVAGRRNGRFLDVHQAWRIYADSVNLDGAETLVDLLKRFSDVFGHPIEVEGKIANFILTAEIPRGRPISSIMRIPPKVDSKGNIESQLVTWTYFFQERPFGNSNQAALVISIDLKRYKNELIKHGW